MHASRLEDSSTRNCSKAMHLQQMPLRLLSQLLSPRMHVSAAQRAPAHNMFVHVSTTLIVRHGNVRQDQAGQTASRVVPTSCTCRYHYRTYRVQIQGKESTHLPVTLDVDNISNHRTLLPILRSITFMRLRLAATLVPRGWSLSHTLFQYCSSCATFRLSRL